MGKMPRTLPGVKGSMRFCPTWIWIVVPHGYERLWSELAARESPEDTYTPLPSGPDIFAATGLSEIVQGNAIDSLVGCGALEIYKGDAKNRRGWHYRTFYDPPAVREQDKRAPEPPKKRVIPAKPDHTSKLTKMVLACWIRAYSEEMGIQYALLNGADQSALKVLRGVARDQKWNGEKAEGFFRVAIRHLKEDSYWGQRVTLAAVAFKANEILQKMTRRRPPDHLAEQAGLVISRMREVDPAAWNEAMRRYEGVPVGGIPDPDPGGDPPPADE